MMMMQIFVIVFMHGSYFFTSSLVITPISNSKLAAHKHRKNQEISKLGLKAAAYIHVICSSDVDMRSALVGLNEAKDADDTLQALLRINTILDEDDGTMSSPIAREEVVKNLKEKRTQFREEGLWREDINFASGVLSKRLDPYRTYALKPYLTIAPYLGGLYYLIALVVQQKYPSTFPTAYLSLVAAFILPVIILLFDA
mmetsp:Transcript_2432/g.3550  ORF Transcript_2432/g.3550 Transcript_2432/m.3550 type:complete len:199 (+) Transcript_2432:110-706(+)